MAGGASSCFITTGNKSNFLRCFDSLRLENENYFDCVFSKATTLNCIGTSFRRILLIFFIFLFIYLIFFFVSYLRLK